MVQQQQQTGLASAREAGQQGCRGSGKGQKGESDFSHLLHKSIFFLKIKCFIFRCTFSLELKVACSVIKNHSVHNCIESRERGGEGEINTQLVDSSKMRSTSATVVD